MAIKGKKKSQKKGGQARRRPATAPRQAAPVGRQVPCYRTSAFRVSALVLIAVIAGLVIVLIQNARDDAKALEKKQDQLDAYTNDVRALIQEVRPAISGMAAVQPGIPPDQLKKLEKDANSWTKDLGKAQATVQTFAAAPGVEDATALYAQSVQLYGSTARSYTLALGLEGEDQTLAIGTASEIKAQAGALWSQATVILDEARSDADMEPSGLTPPDPAAAGGVPGASPPGAVPPGVVPPGGGVPPVAPEAPPGGGGGGQGSGGDKGAGSGQGKGSGGGTKS
jgi:hypothetical protein